MQDWIAGPTDEPVLRDDFLSKVYSMWACDPDQRRMVVEDRVFWLDREIEFFSGSIDSLHRNHGGDVADPDKWPFCRDILMQRRLAIYREERLWCLRILGQLDQTEIKKGRPT